MKELILAAGLCLAMMYSDAQGHSFYDAYCCNEKDCRPAAKGSVIPVDGGFLVKRQWFMTADQIVPYNFRNLKEAPDGAYHICLNLYGKVKGNVRCLYKPNLGF